MINNKLDDDHQLDCKKPAAVEKKRSSSLPVAGEKLDTASDEGEIQIAPVQAEAQALVEANTLRASAELIASRRSQGENQQPSDKTESEFWLVARIQDCKVVTTQE